MLPSSRLAARALRLLSLAVVPALVLAGLRPAAAQEPATPATPRVVCVGGALTETVFALGAGEQVVAVDTGSTYPPEARERTQLGYQRALSAEGLLALHPTLVLVTPDAGPPAVLTQLRDAGVAVHVIPAEHTLAGAEAKIEAVAQALGRQPQGATLLAALRADVERARETLAQVEPAAAPPRVLCLYARARGTLYACGRDTALDAMATLAGGVNALGELRGSVPLGGEAAVAAAPDVILLPRGSADISGGGQTVLQEAGLALTPAGRAGRVVVMDDLLLTGFGPRTGQALLELVRALHAPPAPVPAVPGLVPAEPAAPAGPAAPATPPVPSDPPSPAPHKESR